MHVRFLAIFCSNVLKAKFKCKLTIHSQYSRTSKAHLWDYENLFATGVVQATEGLLQSQVRRHNRDIFSIFFSMKVYCVFSLETPQRRDSNEYTQYTISQYKKKKNHPKLSPICNYGICSKGFKNEFETAVVNEPSVFEPLTFHCTMF